MDSLNNAAIYGFSLIFVCCSPPFSTIPYLNVNFASFGSLNYISQFHSLNNIGLLLHFNWQWFPVLCHRTAPI
jgi:hypothetical protein